LRQQQLKEFKLSSSPLKFDKAAGSSNFRKTFPFFSSVENSTTQQAAAAAKKRKESTDKNDSLLLLLFGESPITTASVLRALISSVCFAFQCFVN